MADAQVISVIQAYLDDLQRQGVSVDFGVLFGSHVNGVPHEWSDIDLVVVSPRFDLTRSWDDVHLLRHTATAVDVRIEPVAVGSRQWEEDRYLPIIDIAHREGTIIWPTESGQAPRPAGEET